MERFQSDELQSLAFIRTEGYHDKRQCPLHIVQLESRVERDAFHELNRKAKQLGGWYSSFKKSDAGFQFLEASQADRFCALLSGDADRTDVLAARKERKELSAAEALHELATHLAARAEESLARSHESLQNTARRADIQAGVRGRAYVDLALSRTMHSVAEALSRGEAKYLGGIRHKTQLETLETMLHLAKWARIRDVQQQPNESHFQHGERQRRAEEEPLSPATIRFAEFPYALGGIADRLATIASRAFGLFCLHRTVNARPSMAVSSLSSPGVRVKLVTAVNDVWKLLHPPQ